MKKSPVIFLEHVLESVQIIEGYLAGKTWEEFKGDVGLQDAVIRRLEIIGEATRNLPDEFVRDWPEIPWRNIVGFRNILVHAYFEVKLERVWEAATRDVGELRNSIEKILEELKNAGQD